MPQNPCPHLRNAHWLAAAGLLLLGTLQTWAQYEPDWTRNFRVGVLAGFNIKASFKMDGDFSVSGSQSGVYDDGYVRVDDTGNALGYTTYWGYENPGQYDEANRRILMHSTSTFGASSRSGQEDDAPYFGFDLAYGGNLWRRERLRVGWEFGFGMLPIAISDNSPMAATLNQDTYAYEVPSGVLIPGAPYHGGPSGYDQPSIRDARTLVGTSSSTNGSISGTRTLDVTLYSFRLGPTLFWDLNRHFGLALSGGPAMGFITGDYRYDESIDTGGGGVQNRGRFGVSDLVYGGYVSATATYHATPGGDFYLGLQYMPLGSSNFSQAGREARLDLSGALYLSAGINWPF